MTKNKAECPNGYTELAAVRVGKNYGHLPGNDYHDVDVRVSRSPAETPVYHVHVVDSAGQERGRDDQETSRITVTGRDQELRVAIGSAGQFGEGANMHLPYLIQATSQALAAAELFEEAEKKAADDALVAKREAELKEIAAKVDKMFSQSADRLREHLAKMFAPGSPATTPRKPGSPGVTSEQLQALRDSIKAGQKACGILDAESPSEEETPSEAELKAKVIAAVEKALSETEGVPKGLRVGIMLKMPISRDEFEAAMASPAPSRFSPEMHELFNNTKPAADGEELPDDVLAAEEAEIRREIINEEEGVRS